MTEILTNTFILGGNITILLGSRPAQLEKDILYSVLYSKLLARRSGTDQESTWASYASTLSKLDWTINERKTSRLEFKKTNLLKLVKLITGTSLSDPEQQALTGVFCDLQALPSDSPAITGILESLNNNLIRRSGDTKTTRATAISLTIVRQNNTMLTLQISFETDATLDTGFDILGLSVLRPIDDQKNNIRYLACYLSENKYSENREDVIKKLGSKIKTELLHVQDPAVEN